MKETEERLQRKRERKPEGKRGDQWVRDNVNHDGRAINLSRMMETDS